MTSLRALLADTGFHGHGLDVAVAVAQAESGAHATSHNTNSGTGDNSYGLFQINMLGSLGPARLAEYHLKSYNDLFDPRVNARVAFEMSNGGTDWQPWTTYTRGTYRQYLGHDVQIDAGGIDPNAGTSDDVTSGSDTTTNGAGGSHHDAFDIGGGQSLTELHAQQQQQHELLQQIDFVTGQGPRPTLHPAVVAAQPDHSAVDTFLSAARGELGESYVFGAKAGASVAHPNALDCSGLTKWAAEQAGAHLPDGAGYQYLALKKAGMLIPVDQAMHTPGALLFHFAAEPQPGQGEPAIAHVAISTGKSTTIEAADPKDGIVSWNAKGRFNYAAIIPGIGAPDPSDSMQDHVDADQSSIDATHAHHAGMHGGATDDLSSVHTWSGHEWHWLGSDLGAGTGADVGTAAEFDDHGAWDAGHH